jgi:hypothetical protein
VETKVTKKKPVKGPMIINLSGGMDVRKSVKDCTLGCKKHCDDPKYPCPIRMLGREFG